MAGGGVSILRADGAVLTFDAVLDYTLQNNVSVSEHPVEQGVDVADHAQVQAGVLTVRAILSESPYSNVSSTGGPERIAAAEAFLRSIAGTLVSVVTTKFGTLTNMSITRFPFPVDKVKRRVLDLEFRQIRVATVSLVDIPPEQPATEETKAGAATTQDAGAQALEDDATNEPEQDAADTSFLLDGLTAIGLEP